MKPLRVSVFPRLNLDTCGTGCGVHCSQCTACDRRCSFLEWEREALDDLYFQLEEVFHTWPGGFQVEFVDLRDIDYALERLNMVLVTSGEKPLTHYTYGEYMTRNAPLMAINDVLVCRGGIPPKAALKRIYQELLKTSPHGSSAPGS